IVPFSASILAGRRNQPAVRLTRTNPAPTPAKSSRYPTISGIVQASGAAKRSIAAVSSLRGGRGGRGRFGGRRRVGWLDPHRFGLKLRRGHADRIQARLAPGGLQWQAGKIDDAAVAAEAAL